MSIQYRKEIDGLRAIAVLPVIFFHAGFEIFSGGYVGVDIFFVISGFLITSIILEEKNKNIFSLVNFYERRIRRIFPALSAVVLITIPFCWIWLQPKDMKDFCESVFANSFFISNFMFYMKSGYFDTVAELKPLLHTWSLSVEEQYYVLFPIFISVIWKIGKKWIVLILILISILSITLAEIQSIKNPTAAFYLLPSRSWELIFGSLLAFNKEQLNDLNLKLSRISLEILSAFGLLMIITAIFLFNERIRYPSLFTLIPTFGTVLIIQFSDSKTLTGRFLGSKFLVSIGLISYSAYLLHQPIFAVAKYRILEPNNSILIILCLFILFLSYLFWKFIETPFRNKNFINRKNIFILFFALSFVFIIFGILGHLKDGYRGREFKVNVISNDFTSYDINKYCKYQNNVKSEFCFLGDVNSKNEINSAIFGDSHSGAILPVVDSIHQIKNKSFLYSGLPGCPSLIGVDVAKGNYAPGVCSELAAKQLAFVKKNKIEKVFLVARWSLYTEGEYHRSMWHYFLVTSNKKDISLENSRLSFIEGLKTTLIEYEKIGAKLYIVLQIPQQKIQPLSLYSRIYDSNKNGTDEALRTINKLSISFPDHLAFQKFNRDAIYEIFKGRENQVINLDTSFCNLVFCPIGNNLGSYYSDDDHANAKGIMRAFAKLDDYYD